MNDNRPRFELPSVDDLFTTQEQRDEAKLAKIYDIEIELIDEFEGHPFHVRDDEDMQLLVDSISKNGVLTPATVRKKEDGRYEMLSGHRRRRACQLLGLKTLRCEVVDLNRDEAIILMCDSNFQRSKILPSEKAFAYKMRLEAMKRQGKRMDMVVAPIEDATSAPVERKLEARDILGKDVGESREQIRRYIRLTELIPGILDMVDAGKIALRPAVEISYLSKEMQEALLETMQFEDCTPTHDQTIRMRKLSNEGQLTQDKVEEIIQEKKPNQVDKIVFRSERINAVLPKGLPAEKREDFVVNAIAHYTRELERRAREREQDR